MIPDLQNINKYKLFTDNTILDAFYKEYLLKTDNDDLNYITIRDNTNIKIIHSIGPNLYKDLDINYLNYITYTKIYNDIYNIFKKYKKEDDNLRLSALSTGLFSGNYLNEILYITALVYIKLYNNYLTNTSDKTKNKIFMYIVEPSNKDKVMFLKNDKQKTHKKFLEIITEIENLHNSSL